MISLSHEIANGWIVNGDRFIPVYVAAAVGLVGSFILSVNSLLP